MTKLEECLFQAADAIEEAKKWFAANDPDEAVDMLRRAQREINGALGCAPGERANETAPKVEAWMVLDCIHLKPSSITLDPEDVRDHRKEHVIPMIRASLTKGR